MSTVSTQDLASARGYLATAMTLLTPSTAPQTVVPVTLGASLQVAHDTNQEGTIFQLEGGDYAGTLVSTKRMTWQADNPNNVPRLVGAGPALMNSASGAVFRGLAFASSVPDATIITDIGDGLVLDHFDIGPTDPVAGQHRGIRIDGKNFTLTTGTIHGCYAVGRDAQGISAWDGMLNGQILDCQIEGGAEGLMLGGADSTSPDRIPTGLLIQRCRFTKNPAWYPVGGWVKCGLEIKSARKISFLDSVIDGAGTSGGQKAYGIDLTTRNQDGHAPWSTIEDIIIDNVLIRYVGGGFNLLGSDDTPTKPSATMQRVAINDVVIEHVNPVGLWGTGGSGRGFLMQRSPVDVQITNITLASDAKGNADFYFAGTPPMAPVRLKISNVDLSQWSASYSFKVDNMGAGLATFPKYAPDAQIWLPPAAGVAAGATLHGYPATFRS